MVDYRHIHPSSTAVLCSLPEKMKMIKKQEEKKEAKGGTTIFPVWKFCFPIFVEMSLR